MTRAPLCLVWLLNSLLLLPGTLSRADSAAAPAVPTGREQEIERLAGQMADRRQELEQTRQEEERLRGELAPLEHKITEHEERLARLEERLALEQAVYDGKEQELTRARATWQQARLHLERRLRVLYTRRGSPLLDLAFSSARLSDLLAFDEAFHAMLAYDQSLLTSYRTTVDEMERSRQALALEQGILQDLLRQETTLKDALTQQRDDKKALLRRAGTLAALRQQALGEMEKGWRRMLAGMEQKRSRKKKAEPPPPADLSRLRGALPPPVAGRLSGDRMNSAEDLIIVAADAAPVRAVAPGTVLFAGYLQGYGNSVVIDHGGEFSSTTGHLGRITVQPQKRVKAGDEIGSASDIAGLMAGGLVFELRQAGRPLPPLEWLRPQAFE